jgi:threonine aldolase
MAALQAANQDHTPAYGGDPWTARAAQLIRELFETECDVFFVFNGTSANCLSLASQCELYHRIICCAYNHLLSDECGAPGFFVHGTTLQGIAASDGKLTPALVEKAALARTNIHHNKAGALVERTNAWLQWFRRIAVRHEYRADIFTGLVHLVCAMVTLRKVSG